MNMRTYRSTFAAFMAGAVMVGGVMFAWSNWNGRSGITPVSVPSASVLSETKVAGFNASASAADTSYRLSGAGTSISSIVEQASPAVVKIETKSATSGLGTGFIFEKSGYILTNQHVVEGAEEIWVSVQGYGEPFKAELLGNSRDLDLAVLKITGSKEFHVLPIGDSAESSVGDGVVAIGSPYGLDQTVTVGILSAKDRPITIADEQSSREYTHLLQTDTSINPGNSGGPLLNLRGEVIGINTAVEANAQGIGFAIPTTTISSVLDSQFFLK